MSKPKIMPCVKVGQVWEDTDPRGTHRRITVVEVSGKGHAVVSSGARRTRIRIDRFRPGSTGYKLVEDV